MKNSFLAALRVVLLFCAFNACYSISKHTLLYIYTTYKRNTLPCHIVYEQTLVAAQNSIVTKNKISHFLLLFRFPFKYIEFIFLLLCITNCICILYSLIFNDDCTTQSHSIPDCIVTVIFYT